MDMHTNASYVTPFYLLLILFVGSMEQYTLIVSLHALKALLDGCPLKCQSDSMGSNKGSKEWSKELVDLQMGLSQRNDGIKCAKP
jgi:hypothetical protein